MFFHSFVSCGVWFHRKLFTGRFSKRKIIIPPQIMLLKKRKTSTLIGNSTITLESQHYIRIPYFFALYFLPDRQHILISTFFHLALPSYSSVGIYNFQSSLNNTISLPASFCLDLHINQLDMHINGKLKLRMTYLELCFPR